MTQPSAPAWPIHPTMITTTSELPGFRIVRGCAPVRGLVWMPMPVSVLNNPLAAAAYDHIGQQTYEYAMGRMMERARESGANAIIGFRCETSGLFGSIVQTVAYGTAVLVVPIA